MPDALFPSDDRPQARRFPLALALLFLALCLATLGREHEGWEGADERFVIAAERWELGAPLPWLSWARVTQTGVAPPLETLPDGSRYLPGLHIDAALLGLALVFAAGITWLAAQLWRRLRPALARLDSLPNSIHVIAVFGAGVGLGVLAGLPHPDWMAWVYLVLPLPLVVVACCWNRPRTWLAAQYLASGVVGISIEMMFDEGRPLVDRALDPKQDFVPEIAVFLADLLLVAALLALMRIARRRTSPVAH